MPVIQRVEGAAHIAFYAVARGGGVLEVRGKRVHLGLGDLVFVREGVAHSLKDHPRSRAARQNSTSS